MSGAFLGCSDGSGPLWFSGRIRGDYSPFWLFGASLMDGLASLVVPPEVSFDVISSRAGLNMLEGEVCV